ncbi:DUF262 domain-containing protein [Macrococcoides caseolyticum]|uniref:DUF262 domain-containing protein n=1 Tax=Macrococcoides caseolyticum TaxID=69966 RepID=UPI001F37E7CE|nr:DUF262 domain-containing protein [Macrococcus caseolyticus]MCE4956049.1 DUF262 domain-containing protein [Macrococcus caseolyticus]
MNEITSKMTSLSQLLLEDSRVFKIPEFQRDFVWGEEQANDLISDMEEDTNYFTKESEELQGYLLGNIVLIENEDKNYLVIDGQQRLTTLTILFKVLYEKIYEIIENSEGKNRDKWLKRIGDISNGYQIVDDEDNFKGLRVIHDEGLSFGSFYRDLIKDQLSADTILINDSDFKIKEVYEQLNEKLQGFSDLQISKFITYIKNKVKLIVTIAPSEGKAFQLFEVLNDRGQSLEPMDLVKNTFLKTLRQSGFNDDDILVLNQNWKSFISNLQLSQKKKIPSSIFIKHFISSEYNKNIKQEDLFKFFKNEVRLSGDEIIEFVKKLNKYSRIYSSIEKDILKNEFLSNNNDMYLVFKQFSIKQFHPILMNFYDAPDEIKTKVIDICSRYGATILFSSTQTNVIEKEMINIINKIKTGDSYQEKWESLERHLKILIENNSEKLKTNIEKSNFANSTGNAQKKVRDMLYFIELKFNNNVLLLRQPKGKRITVEHILAKKSIIDNLDNYGFSNNDEFTRYLNRIGNLTLLYHDENTSVGAKLFSEKLETYKNSDFIITKTIVTKIETTIKNGVETSRVSLINEHQPQYETNGKWTKREIELRSEIISNLVDKMVKGY